MIYLVSQANHSVTSMYLEVIKAGFELAGGEVTVLADVSQCRRGRRSDIYVVSTPIEATRLWLSGRRRLVTWFQGVTPEESFMKHKSRARFAVLRAMEFLALRASLFVFFVSSSMREHYEKTYRWRIPPEQRYEMPCFNEVLHEDAFFTPNKYTRLRFAYVGSLAVWQCFEATLRVYREFELLGLSGTSLLVLTADSAEAHAAVARHGIENFTIDSVSSEQVAERLRDVRFGFVLRDDNVINHVSTPTKISGYMASGVIPICSAAVHDFADLARGLRYAIVVEGNSSLTPQLRDALAIDVDAHSILEEYSRVFKQYYSPDWHVSQISSKISKVLESQS